jgi:hypothetical protein
MIMGIRPMGHGETDRKIARNLPALRGLPTGMKKQIRKPSTAGQAPRLTIKWTTNL